MKNIKSNSTLSLINKPRLNVSTKQKIMNTSKPTFYKYDAISDFRKTMLRNIGTMNKQEIEKQRDELKFNIMQKKSKGT